MSEIRKISLTQAVPENDHAARVLREKLGNAPASPDHPAPPTVIEAAMPQEQGALEDRIIEAIRTVYDPEIPVNVYDLGLIYRLQIDPAGAVKVDMTLTAPGCPVAGDIVAAVKRAIEAIPEVPRADIELVWDPPWSRERLSEAARLELGL